MTEIYPWIKIDSFWNVPHSRDEDLDKIEKCLPSIGPLEILLVVVLLAILV